MEHVCKDIANRDIAERERTRFNVQDQVLHLERENLTVDNDTRGAAALNHEMACAVAVELCHRTKEIQEVFAVLGVEFCNETGIDEDELWAVTFGIETR